MQIREYIQSIFRAIIQPWGRAEDTEYTWTQGSPDDVEQRYGLTPFYEASLTPYVFAAMNMRKHVASLFVSATGLKPNDTGAYFPPQIIPPPFSQTIDQQHLEFTQWQYDEALERDFSEILRDALDSTLTYGRAVIENMWTRGETPFSKTPLVYATNFQDKDPERFILNPQDREPGIYEKQSYFDDSNLERMPDRKFMVITNHGYFQNPYGIAELRPLFDTLKGIKEGWKNWNRGIERAGTGQWMGTYPKTKSGKDTDRAQWRAKFLADLTKMSSDKVIIKEEGVLIEALKAEIESSAFQSNIELAIRIVSIVLLHNPTALLDGQYGSYGAEESKGTRAKSELQQDDANMLSNAWTYQAIPWGIDYNWSDVQVYPWLQIIQPERIVPATPKDQEQNINAQQEEEPEKEKSEVEEEKEFIQIYQDKEGEEEEKPSTIKNFPAKAPAPDIFGKVAKDAKKALDAMPVYNKQDFDGLPQKDKENSFTISSLGSTKGRTELITRLKNEIADTLKLTNEAEAWEVYRKKARTIFVGASIPFEEEKLIASFRFARSKAYSDGTMELAQREKDSIHGLIQMTANDSDVRASHRAYHKVIRPIDDPIWEKIRAPIEFDCRCWEEIITKEMFEADPVRYAYTKKLPEIVPKRFS
ncbi:MAG TPA: DUF935 family protein [Desulfosporosinus sp.]|nr:DUF935 family protein [Desulfosporosinus sp.]